MNDAGQPSQTPKEDGRGSGLSAEILGLKRPYDVMEGGRGLPMRDALSATNCEGKAHLAFISEMCQQYVTS